MFKTKVETNLYSLPEVKISGDILVPNKTVYNKPQVTF